MKILPFLLFLFSATVIFSQPLEQRLQTHQATHHIEKIYISHNQPYYAPGDTLYGKLFLVNGRSHEYFDGTPIVYVDWMTESGTVQVSLLLKVEEGTANISIPILREYGEGRYLLRAYTQYQKNFEEYYIFQKEIKVIGETPLQPKETIGDKTDIKLQFFPEGGQLVEGLPTNLAFEVKNGRGKPIDVSGVILNKNNQEIGQFKTYNEGIGIINFSPEKGQKYLAKINWNGLLKVVDLPIALKEGFVLTANNRKKETLSLKITTNTTKGIAGCTLIGHLRGQPFFSQTFKEGNMKKLLINKTEIPSGVLHFTLFDAKDRPVCERLIFNNNPKEAVDVEISLPKINYGVKELVKGAVLGKIGEKPIKGDLTVTVYNKEVFGTASAGTNIKNYLLLQSDLKGRISNINQYFEKDDAKSRTLLDYVMLTHGWRRFNWQDVIDAVPTPIVFPTEERISFAGKIMKDNNRDTPIKGDVYLSILDKVNFTSAELTTEADGLFYFQGFDLPDSTEILIQGNVYNGKKKDRLKKGEARRVGNKNVKFELLNLHDIEFNPDISLKRIPYNRAAQLSFATEVNRIRKVDTIYHPEWTIDLDAVTVRGQKMAESRKKEAETRRKFKERGLFYSNSSQKVYMEDLVAGGATYTDVYDVIRDRVVGAQITTTAEGKQVLLRGQSSINNPTYATIELDGILVSASTVANIVPTNIDMIDVKKGLSTTAIYGEAGNGGIITIITKDPAANKAPIRRPGILTIEHPGYHKARTFYQPAYPLTGIDREKPDYRTSLYWNPDATIGQGTTPIEFYTGDKLAEFLIFVEGITADGLPFVGKKVIKVGK